MIPNQCRHQQLVKDMEEELSMICLVSIIPHVSCSLGVE